MPLHQRPKDPPQPQKKRRHPQRLVQREQLRLGRQRLGRVIGQVVGDHPKRESLSGSTAP